MQVKVEITDTQIGHLLVSAFEGGSNYWYEIVFTRKPKKFAYRISPTTIFKHVDYPMNVGGALTIRQTVDPLDGPTARILNREAIHRGLQQLAESHKYRHHFSDILADDTDATTGDVFLQFALYGDVLFG